MYENDPAPSTEPSPEEPPKRKMPKRLGPTVGELLRDPELLAKYQVEHGELFADIAANARSAMQALSLKVPELTVLKTSNVDYGALGRIESPGQFQRETTHAVQSLASRIEALVGLVGEQSVVLHLMHQEMQAQGKRDRWLLGIAAAASSRPSQASSSNSFKHSSRAPPEAGLQVRAVRLVLGLKSRDGKAVHHRAECRKRSLRRHRPEWPFGDHPILVEPRDVQDVEYRHQRFGHESG